MGDARAEGRTGAGYGINHGPMSQASLKTVGWGLDVTACVTFRLQEAAGGVKDRLGGGGRLGNADGALAGADGCGHQSFGKPAPWLLACNARWCAA